MNDETQLDIDTLADDLTGVLKEVFPDRNVAPNLVLVWHSMVRLPTTLVGVLLMLVQGGSVIVKACPAIQKDVAPVVGVCNLDVVEGPSGRIQLCHS